MLLTLLVSCAVHSTPLDINAWRANSGPAEYATAIHEYRTRATAGTHDDLIRSFVHRDQTNNVWGVAAAITRSTSGASPISTRPKSWPSPMRSSDRARDERKIRTAAGAGLGFVLHL